MTFACTSRTTANRNSFVSPSGRPKPFACTSRTTANRNEHLEIGIAVRDRFACTSRTTANRNGGGPAAGRARRTRSFACTSRTTANRNVVDGAGAPFDLGRSPVRLARQRIETRRVLQTHPGLSRSPVRLARQRIETFRTSATQPISPSSPVRLARQRIETTTEPSRPCPASGFACTSRTTANRNVPPSVAGDPLAVRLYVSHDSE